MPATCPDTRWADRQAQRTQRLKSSIIRELLTWAELPDVLSFAGGLPAPEVFPVEEVSRASASVLEQFGSRALQYSTTEGYVPLWDLLVEHMAQYGIYEELNFSKSRNHTWRSPKIGVQAYACTPIFGLLQV